MDTRQPTEPKLNHTTLTRVCLRFLWCHDPSVGGSSPSVAALGLADLDPLSRALSELAAGVSDAIEPLNSQMRSITEAVTRISNGYQSAFSAAEALARQLSENQ